MMCLLNCMKTSLGHVILLFFLCSLLSVKAASTNFTHTQTFKWNKELWGTYNLQNEHIVYRKGKKTWRKKLTDKMSDVVFQGKKLILIKEHKLLPNHSSMSSQSFQFRRNKNNFKIVDRYKSKKLSRLFENDIYNNLSGVAYRDGKVIYDDFRCIRNKKNTLTCVIKGRIKEGVKRVTLK